MSEQCQRGLSAETLSAWRAKALPAGKQNEITAHIASCSTCQATLAGFERVAQVLRTPPAMPTQAAVWRSVQASISTSNIRGTMTKSQKTLTLSGLGVAASLVTIVAIVFVLLNNHPGQPHPISVVGSPSPTATTLPSPTPTVDVLKTSLPSQGWVTVPSLSFAKNMTFSASDPLTGYACGNIGSSATAPLELSVTHDGGRTWQESTTTVSGATCLIYANPANSEDVVMIGHSCWTGCYADATYPHRSDATYPYRSLDGGQTWTKLQMPTDEQSDNISISQPVWIGSNVYFTVQEVTTSAFPARPLHTILVNKSGSTLASIDDRALLLASLMLHIQFNLFGHITGHYMPVLVAPVTRADRVSTPASYSPRVTMAQYGSSLQRKVSFQIHFFIILACHF